jgi:hypothetical protein
MFFVKILISLFGKSNISLGHGKNFIFSDVLVLLLLLLLLLLFLLLLRKLGSFGHTNPHVSGSVAIELTGVLALKFLLFFWRLLQFFYSSSHCSSRLCIRASV